MLWSVYDHTPSLQMGKQRHQEIEWHAESYSLQKRSWSSMPACLTAGHGLDWDSASPLCWMEKKLLIIPKRLGLNTEDREHGQSRNRVRYAVMNEVTPGSPSSAGRPDSRIHTESQNQKSLVKQSLNAAGKTGWKWLHSCPQLRLSYFANTAFCVICESPLGEETSLLLGILLVSSCCGRRQEVPIIIRADASWTPDLCRWWHQGLDQTNKLRKPGK